MLKTCNSASWCYGYLTDGLRKKPNISSCTICIKEEIWAREIRVSHFNTIEQYHGRSNQLIEQTWYTSLLAWLTCKTGQTIAADDSVDSSNEVEDSNPRPVVNVPLEDIATGKFSLVYAHPEALMSTASGEALLNKLQKGGVISCIAVDKAHMILEWWLYFSILCICTQVQLCGIPSQACSGLMGSYITKFRQWTQACLMTSSLQAKCKWIAILFLKSHNS